MSRTKDTRPAEKRNAGAGLLDAEVSVVNVGLVQFAGDLREQDVKVVQVDWVPPAGGNVELARLLSKLED